MRTGDAASAGLSATTLSMSDETKPITVEEFTTAIADISDQQIELVKAQLLNSIDRLLETNLELSHEVKGVKDKLRALKPDDAHDELRDDLLLFLETIRENNGVIDDQVKRVKVANAEMVKRGTMAPSSQQTQESKLDDRVSLLKLAVEQEMGVDVVWNMVNATDDNAKDTNEPATTNTDTTAETTTAEATTDGTTTADTKEATEEGVYL